MRPRPGRSGRLRERPAGCGGRGAPGRACRSPPADGGAGLARARCRVLVPRPRQTATDPGGAGTLEEEAGVVVQQFPGQGEQGGGGLAGRLVGGRVQMHREPPPVMRIGRGPGAQDLTRVRLGQRGWSARPHSIRLASTRRGRSVPGPVLRVGWSGVGGPGGGRSVCAGAGRPRPRSRRPVRTLTADTAGPGCRVPAPWPPSSDSWWWPRCRWGSRVPRGSAGRPGPRWRRPGTDSRSRRDG